MDVTQIEMIDDTPGNKTFALDLSTAIGDDNLVFVVAYYDKEKDRVIIRTDNYQIARTDSAGATIRSLEAFHLRMASDGVDADQLSNMPGSRAPYNLLSDPARPRGFFA